MKRKNTGRTGGVRGSMTVEAALIVPLVFLMVIVLLLLAFRMHNQAWYTAAAAEAAISAAAQETQRSRDGRELLTEKIRVMQNGSGLPSYGVVVHGSVSEREALVTIEGAGIPMFGSKWHFNVSETIDIVRPVPYIRKMQGLAEVGRD